MPCYDERSTYDYGRREGEAERRRLEKRADTNARIACEALSMIESSSRYKPASISRLSEDAQRWWKEHKKFDEKRKSR